jgi:hypothetical protein
MWSDNFSQSYCPWIYIFPSNAEIEGFDSIHKVPSRKNLMLLANQIKEIFIVM